MVLKTYIERIIRFLAFLAMIIMFSCEKLSIVTNCEECYTDEPEETILVIKTDPSFQNAVPYKITVTIYEGNLEDNIVTNEFQTATAETDIAVKLNKKYTVTAIYSDMDGNIITAVDSATPRVRYEKNVCDKPCYWIYDKVINLRIKYY